MENLFVLNKAGSHLTPDTYRELELLEVEELFDVVRDMVDRQQKEYEQATKRR